MDLWGKDSVCHLMHRMDGLLMLCGLNVPKILGMNSMKKSIIWKAGSDACY